MRLLKREPWFTILRNFQKNTGLTSRPTLWQPITFNLSNVSMTGYCEMWCSGWRGEAAACQRTGVPSSTTVRQRRGHPDFDEDRRQEATASSHGRPRHRRRRGTAGGRSATSAAALALRQNSVSDRRRRNSLANVADFVWIQAACICRERRQRAAGRFEPVR